MGWSSAASGAVVVGEVVVVGSVVVVGVVGSSLEQPVIATAAQTTVATTGLVAR